MKININKREYHVEENEFNKIPYSDNIGFRKNQYELKYTYFNGLDFENRSNKNTLI